MSHLQGTGSAAFQNSALRLTRSHSYFQLSAPSRLVHVSSVQEGLSAGREFSTVPPGLRKPPTEVPAFVDQRGTRPGTRSQHAQPSLSSSGIQPPRPWSERSLQVATQQSAVSVAQSTAVEAADAPTQAQDRQSEKRLGVASPASNSGGGGGGELGRNGELYIPPDPTTESTGMAVTWLGTSSGAPTRRRNVSSIALRTRQQTLVVDCGEATNRQIAVTGIHPLSITNIFITHMHGDHCFGLTGVLMMISEARAGTPLSQTPLRVFGPPGIQDLVASTLRYSMTRLSMPLIVAQFAVQPEASSPPQPVPGLPGVAFAVLGPDHTDRAKRALARRPRRSDQRNVHEIDVTEGLAWTIPCEHGLTVTAAQLLHRVPCWGYVIKEADTPATERPETIRDAGMKPGEAMRLLREGGGPLDAVPTPSGKQVQLRDLLNPPVAGRKVVLLGDTCDSRAIAEVARGADLLSHEATFSDDMAPKAYKAQHSTAGMAGAFARQIDASILVLTHFSGRYAANRLTASKDSFSDQASQDASAGDIWVLLREAKASFRAPNVFPAQDFFTYEVWNRQQLAEQQILSRANRLTQEQQAGLILENSSTLHRSEAGEEVKSRSTRGGSRGRGGRPRGGGNYGGRSSSSGGRPSPGRGRNGPPGRGGQQRDFKSSSEFAFERRQKAAQNNGHQFDDLDY